MNIISGIISLIEILGGFLIYNIFINYKLFHKINTKLILAIITAFIYIILSGYYNSDPLVILVGLLFVNSIIISKIELKDTILTFIELIISFLVLCILELVSTSIIHLIIGENDANPFTFLIVLSIILFFIILLISKSSFNTKIKFEEFLAKYKIINIIVLNLFIFFLLIKSLMTSGLLDSNMIIHITILGIILIGVNCYFYIHLYNTLNEKKKNEIKKSFNPLINDLMSKVKANEHEYKNHLNTIWSIAQVSKQEEVKDKLKEYISTIIDDTDEFAMLLNVENTIIKAILYNKGQRAEKLGISYNYNIKSDLKNISLDNSELTVILSNLINNAIEATSMIKQKEFEVNIGEDNKNYIINIKNMSEGIKIEDLSSIFKMGYTTKGEGRGYGLYNVKKIVDKHKGKIQISLEEDIVNISILLHK